ncbi:hypothetical protein [Pectinatus cerevisiiphilus]
MSQIFLYISICLQYQIW